MKKKMMNHYLNKKNIVIFNYIQEKKLLMTINQHLKSFSLKYIWLNNRINTNKYRILIKKA
jgi:hypothetical protein